MKTKISHQVSNNSRRDAVANRRPRRLLQRTGITLAAIFCLIVITGGVYSARADLTGNTCWVDSVNGSNTLGQCGNLDHPFKTLTAAKSAANSGNVIIVLPGSYNENNLLKNGVNWHFMAGAKVTCPTSPSAAIFDDGTNGANAAVSCIISGQGTFDGATLGVISLNYTGGGSNVSFTADTVTSTVTTIASKGATLHVKANVINSTGTSAAAIWWFSGPMHVEAHEILCAGNAGIYTTAPSGATGYLWVQANSIMNTTTTPTTSNKAVYIKDAEPSIREWIQALQIQGPIAVYTANGAGGEAGLIYVRAQKIFGEINHSAGTLYLDAQKISDDGLNTNLINLSGGNSWLNILQLDDLGLTSSPAAVTVSAGTHYLRGSSLTRSTSGDGLDVSGGSLTVNGLAVSTQSGFYDLAQSGGTLTVLGCAYSLAKTSGTITQGDPLPAGYGTGPALPSDGSTYKLFVTAGHVYVWNGSSWLRIDN